MTSKASKSSKAPKTLKTVKTSKQQSLFKNKDKESNLDENEIEVKTNTKSKNAAQNDAAKKKLDNVSENNDFEADIEKFRKTLTNSVSYNALDVLESEVDVLNDTSNLSEKVKLHASLVSHTKQMGMAIDSMVEIINQIDVNAASEAIKKDNEEMENTDVSDNVANLNKLLTGLKSEDVMQIKIMYMKKIIDTIAKCRATCEQNMLTIKKCH